MVEEIYLLRKKRIIHPEGEFDKSGRWYPSDNEKCSCCDKVKPPSREHPFTLLVHCRSRNHIENLLTKAAL